MTTTSSDFARIPRVPLLASPAPSRPPRAPGPPAPPPPPHPLRAGPRRPRLLRPGAGLRPSRRSLPGRRAPPSPRRRRPRDLSADAAARSLLRHRASPPRAGASRSSSSTRRGLLPPRLGPEDLAATAYLDHPTLFSSVRVSSAADSIKGFALYKASGEREPDFGAAAIETTKACLAAWFDARHRTAHCAIPRAPSRSGAPLRDHPRQDSDDRRAHRRGARDQGGSRRQHAALVRHLLRGDAHPRGARARVHQDRRARELRARVRWGRGLLLQDVDAPRHGAAARSRDRARAEPLARGPRASSCADRGRRVRRFDRVLQGARGRRAAHPAEGATRRRARGRGGERQVPQGRRRGSRRGVR